jgi:cell division protein FtsX
MNQNYHIFVTGISRHGRRHKMTFATYAIVIISCTLLGYMIGVSDGKVEGRIESFKEKR